MIEIGNLPAAATLMDHWDLHGDIPPLDPLLVEASARERAAAHLQLPICASRVSVLAVIVGCCCSVAVAVPPLAHAGSTSTQAKGRRICVLERPHAKLSQSDTRKPHPETADKCQYMEQVVVVDGAQALLHAQNALTDPPAVGGRGGLPGVTCVGLDVENCPITNSAMLLQVW